MSKQQQPSGDIVFYTTPEGNIRVDVLFEDETFWLTQKRIADLFEVDRSVITKHLGNIFAEGELERESACAEFAHTAGDGKVYQVQFYNLDAIIAVGYRVNSHRATRFRIWATQTLREFIIKGFVLDDERLKLNRRFGKDYFYQKITDIFEHCSIDYDRDSEITRTFFATVQNKLHFAVTGQTAAEIIASRADAGSRRWA